MFQSKINPLVKNSTGKSELFKIYYFKKAIRKKSQKEKSHQNKIYPENIQYKIPPVKHHLGKVT